MMRRTHRLTALEFQHAQRDGHVGIRRNDINVVRCDPQVVGDFAHRHRSDPRQNLHQCALVVGVAMLHQHKTHARVRRQMLQQVRESFQPTRRRANADDGKGWGWGFGLWLGGGRGLFNPRLRRSSPRTRFLFPRGFLASRFFARLLQLSLISIAFFGFHSRLQSSKFSSRKKPWCSHIGFSAQSLICHELNEWLSSLRLPCESPTLNYITISVLAGSFLSLAAETRVG